MSLWRQLTRGLRVLTNRAAADRDVADEVDHFLDEATAAHIADGLSPDAARRAARMDVGNTALVREGIRDGGWEHVVASFFDDLRYAARRLRKEPAYTVVVAVTLALGIGATTAIFSAVNPILLEPLPYSDAGQIVSLFDRGADGSRMDVTFGTFCELEARAQSFAAVAAFKPWQPSLTGSAEPERLRGQRVSSTYFRVLGVRPNIGRDFEAADDRAGGPDVAILSDGLWRRRFGADPSIVGRQVLLDDVSVTVLGVMPRGFENVLAPASEVWAPLQYNDTLPLNGREWGHHLRMVGRLRPGVRLSQTIQEIDRIAHTQVAAFARPPWARIQQGLLVSSLQDDVTRAIRPSLLIVVGAVLLVLAIACANVTNLLLARGVQRRGEFALRAALGAGRSRVFRQLLTESLLLAVVGGAIGVAVAFVGVRGLLALSPPGLPRGNAIAVDRMTLVFTLAVTTAVGLLVGLVPAWHAARGDLQPGLQQASRRASAGHQFVRRLLVVAEVALALVLLVGAGLLLRSLEHLFAVDPGFDPARVLTMQVRISARRFDNATKTNQFFDQALDAVLGVPGVVSAAFTSQLPLSGDFEQYGARFESSPADSANDDHSVFRYAVTPGYFRTVGIPLKRGRLLDERDHPGAPVAVVIAESLARRRFPGQDPIGQHMHLGRTDLPWSTIVGVVGDVKQTTLSAVGEADGVYITTSQWYATDNVLSLVVRARGDAAPLASAVKQAIWTVDQDQPVVRVETMEGLVEASAAERRFVLTLFQVFGASALLLALTGIYGVLSGSVTERTREIGVRSALGASRVDIVALVVGQGMALTWIGVAFGVTGAVAASNAVTAMLFGVSRLDPITYAGVVTLLTAVSAIACSVPAWRAARIDPSTTLRAE